MSGADKGEAWIHKHACSAMDRGPVITLADGQKVRLTAGFSDDSLVTGPWKRRKTERRIVCRSCGAVFRETTFSNKE